MLRSKLFCFGRNIFSAKWSRHFFAVLQIACDIVKSYWVLQYQISQHSECLWLSKRKKNKTLNENENHMKKFCFVFLLAIYCRYSDSKLSDFIWFYLCLYFPDYTASWTKGCRAEIGSCSLLIPGVFSLRGTAVCQQSNGSGQLWHLECSYTPAR